MLSQTGGAHRYERVITVDRSNVEVAQPATSHEELGVVGDLRHIDVRQPTGNLVADVRVEQQPDDSELEVALQQAGTAPVQHSGDLSTVGVVQDVLGLWSASVSVSGAASSSRPVS